MDTQRTRGAGRGLGALGRALVFPRGDGAGCPLRAWGAAGQGSRWAGGHRPSCECGVGLPAPGAHPVGTEHVQKLSPRNRAAQGAGGLPSGPVPPGQEGRPSSPWERSPGPGAEPRPSRAGDSLSPIPSPLLCGQGARREGLGGPGSHRSRPGIGAGPAPGCQALGAPDRPHGASRSPGPPQPCPRNSGGRTRPPWGVRETRGCFVLRGPGWAPWLVSSFSRVKSLRLGERSGSPQTQTPPRPARAHMEG